MKKIKVQLEAEIEIEFDENSEEFKTLWESYLEYFDSQADYESFCENIAMQVAKHGTEEHIDGVGYLKVNGENQWIFSRGDYKEVLGLVNINMEQDLNSRINFKLSSKNVSEDEKEQNP